LFGIFTQSNRSVAPVHIIERLVPTIFDDTIAYHIHIVVHNTIVLFLVESRLVIATVAARLGSRGAAQDYRHGAPKWHCVDAPQDLVAIARGAVE
jgi:hypothetical protein